MKGFLILAVLFILIGLAVAFIDQNGGWHGGCTGHCSTCHSHCEDPEKKKEQQSE